MLEETFYIYILANQRNTVLYIGITNNIHNRTVAHKEGHGSKFTKKYNVDKLVYFEEYSDPREAIAREKQLKNYSRKKKNELINNKNKDWHDLFNELDPY